MIIDLKQMSSGKEQKKNWTENNGTKKTTFFCLWRFFFVCSDKSLLICVRSYNTLKLPANHRSASV